MAVRTGEQRTADVPDPSVDLLGTVFGLPDAAFVRPDSAPRLAGPAADPPLGDWRRSAHASVR